MKQRVLERKGKMWKSAISFGHVKSLMALAKVVETGAELQGVSELSSQEISLSHRQ